MKGNFCYEVLPNYPVYEVFLLNYKLADDWDELIRNLRFNFEARRIKFKKNFNGF